MKVLMYLNVVMLLFLIQCTEKEKMIGTMTVIKEIPLEKPMMLSTITEVDGNYAAYNYIDRTFVLISPEGKTLWTYDNQGKGPGEYSAGIGIYGYYNKTMYVVDNVVSKIMLFTYDDVKQTFAFTEEYLFNDGQGIDSLFITETGRVLVPVPIGKNGLVETDLKCTVVNRYLPQALPSEDADDLKAMMDADFALAGNDTWLMRGNIFSNVIQFMKKTDSGYEMIKSRNALRSSKKTSDKQTTGNSESVNVVLTAMGVIALKFVHEHYYIMIATPADEKESIVEVYDTNGRYKGYYLLEGERDEQIRRVDFCNDGSFVFMKSRKNEAGKMRPDMNKLYIGKFEDTK